MSENPNYYAIIPASVRYDDALTDFEKLVFGEISALANKQGFCSASNFYFAGLYKKSESTISRAVANLEEQGHIRSTIEENYKRKIYLITDPLGKIAGGGYAKSPRGGTQKPQENNTSLNSQKTAAPVLEVKDDPKPKTDRTSKEVYFRLIKWAEGERGFPFLKGSITKQFAAFKEAKANGLKPSQMQERWGEMAGEPFWEEKGFDWMDVVKSFNKRPHGR